MFGVAAVRRGPLPTRRRKIAAKAVRGSAEPAASASSVQAVQAWGAERSPRWNIETLLEGDGDDSSSWAGLMQFFSSWIAPAVHPFRSKPTRDACCCGGATPAGSLAVVQALLASRPAADGCRLKKPILRRRRSDWWLLSPFRSGERAEQHAEEGPACHAAAQAASALPLASQARVPRGAPPLRERSTARTGGLHGRSANSEGLRVWLKQTGVTRTGLRHQAAPAVQKVSRSFHQFTACRKRLIDTLKVLALQISSG